MNSLWHIAAYEYRRNAFKKSFILVLLSVPLMMALNIGMGFFMESMRMNDAPVGYLDQAGVFSGEVSAAPFEQDEDPIEFIAYPNDEKAQAALEANQIQAYFTLPTDYPETRNIILTYVKKPGDNVIRQFYNFLQFNLVENVPEQIAYRVAIGTDVTVRSLDGKRIVPSGGPVFSNLMPILITMAFLALLLMTSGYLLGAVADEKENRTMEILVTSVSPVQLLGGKVIGIVGIGMTLLASWVLVILISIFIAVQMGIGWFQNLDMDWGIVIGTTAIALPAYVLVCALMAALGAMVTSTQEGQSLSAIFIILHVLPTYASWIFISDPHSTTAVILSMLPFTSLVAVGLRSIFAVVPAWQIAVSVAVQSISAVFAVWLAGRAFRLGMLRYGQRLTWRGLFSA